MASNNQVIKKSSRLNKFMKEVVKYKSYFFLLIPVVLFYFIFLYKPMYGVIIAFRDFNFRLGINGSPWVGLKHFQAMFSTPGFMNALKNTFLIALGRIVIEFPLPIFLAILINEIKSDKSKKIFQTIYTFPHFLSWVIISGIALNLLGDSGVINGILNLLGLGKINVLSNPSLFRGFIFGSNIWKEMGWGTIIFLAAMAGINPSLYEAAEMDGANRFQRILHITIPSIMPTITVLLLLRVGQVMSLGGFDQILNTYNPAVEEVSDILDTFVYRRTFVLGESFSSSAAVGLFKSVVNCALLFITNIVVKRSGQEGIM